MVQQHRFEPYVPASEYDPYAKYDNADPMADNSYNNNNNTNHYCYNQTPAAIPASDYDPYAEYDDKAFGNNTGTPTTSSSSCSYGLPSSAAPVHPTTTTTRACLLSGDVDGDPYNDPMATNSYNSYNNYNNIYNKTPAATTPASEYDPYAEYDDKSSGNNTTTTPTTSGGSSSYGLPPSAAPNAHSSNSNSNNNYALRTTRIHLPPKKDWAGNGDSGDKIRVHRELPASMFEGGTLTSIKVAFKFKDQGWGNQKGQIYIGELEELDYVLTYTYDSKEYWRRAKLPRPKLGCSRILAESEKAPHKSGHGEVVYEPECEEEEVPSQPQPPTHQKKRYGICYKIGGGGGHKLSIKDIVVTVTTRNYEEIPEAQQHVLSEDDCSGERTPWGPFQSNY